MRKSKGRNRPREEQRFNLAREDSTGLFQGVVDDIRFPIEPDDFLLQELGRLIEDGESSLETEDFHFVISQGIRLHVNPNIELRARLAEALRRAQPGMRGPVRRVAHAVVGAIEDVDFSLEVVGTVVRGYTNQLLEAVEQMSSAPGVDEDGREWIQQWTKGALDRMTLVGRFRDAKSAGVPAVADLLFDSLEDPTRIDAALELLSAIGTPVAGRVLAYAISEPILEEAQEERARESLRVVWPLVLPYVLYNLRRHSHEDIPFRWLELLVETDNTRAVDRILEEVVAHARSESYHEDLLTALPLLDRSNDPGIVGKLLRLVTRVSLPEEAIELIQRWIEGSPLRKPLEEALARWKSGETILIPRNEDFSAFAAERGDRSLADLRDDWNAAYHESLGWQQRRQFPRGPIETRFDRQLEEEMIDRLSLNPRLEEPVLRDQVESFRDNWLVTSQDDVVPLTAICLERQRNTPWLEEIYWSKINAWYIKAAQYFDEGDQDKARHYLDIILGIEPEYPLARMLDGIIGTHASAIG